MPAGERVSARLFVTRERLEHGGWPDEQVAQANPDRRENGVADRGSDNRRARPAAWRFALEPFGRCSAISTLLETRRHMSVGISASGGPAG